MKNSIETIDVGVRINGVAYPPNTLLVNLSNPKKRVSVYYITGGIIANLSPDDTNIDGEKASSAEQIDSFIREKGFSKGGGSTGEGVQSIVEGDGISVDNSDPKNPVISTQEAGVSGTITASGTGVMGQQITFNMGNPDLDYAVVTAMNEPALNAGIQHYTVVAGVITITIVQAQVGESLVYSFASGKGYVVIRSEFEIAADEAEAISLSQANPGIFYYWEEA